MKERIVLNNRPDDNTLGSNKPDKPSEEEWREEFRALKDLRKKIMLRVFPENEATNEELYGWFEEKRSRFNDMIKAGGFEEVCTKYAAYHVNVGGSSTGPDSSPFVDFPEPYSLKTFYTAALAELESLEKTR